MNLKNKNRDKTKLSYPQNNLETNFYLSVASCNLSQASQGGIGLPHGLQGVTAF